MKVKWNLKYLPEAEDDLKDLDNSIRKRLYKSILRTVENPLPKHQGGYGELLGNKFGINLTGFLKIKLHGIGMRVVYKLEEPDMLVIIAVAREDYKVYKEAENRINKYNL